MSTKNDKETNLSSDNDVAALRSAMAKLGLQIIDDIIARRVTKPQEHYNALVSIFNAIK